MTERNKAHRDPARQRPLMTREYLRSIMYYDPATGHLIWKVKRKRILVGAVAGSQTGYAGGKPSNRFLICIDGITYGGHRLVWLWHTGTLLHANIQIDHRDSNPGNNKIDNLRISTQGQNLMNTVLRSDSTSGVKGVSWDKTHSRWVSKIQFDGKIKTLGYFREFEDAVAARRAAEIVYHGEFAKKPPPND